MSTQTSEATGLTQRSTTIEKKQFERDYQPPNFTIKEIRDAIPPHLFERNGWIAASYVATDLAIAGALFYAATFIDLLPEQIRYVAWPLYWVAQGVVLTGVWVMAHECGHQAFSNSKFVNNTVGWVLHSFLLVPYHSWRISHSTHHKATAHMTRDQVFVPKTRSNLGLPSKEEDSVDDDHSHSVLEEAPLIILLRIVIMLTLGWPGYLLLNLSGQDYGRWTSHFHSWSPIFQPHQARDVWVSDFGMIGTLASLCYASYVTSPTTVAKYYVIPYLFVNFWLVLITYLQHTDPEIPHYREAEWNFQRGAACTVDRSFGWVLNHFFHHIADSHVAHHFFSTMPHWNAVKATPYIKKALGDYYLKDDTPIPIALWKSYTSCKFVEDDGDVVFYRH